MCEKEDEDRIIHDSDFNLTDDMNSTIVGLLRLKNNDIVAMYAAKLIEHYQCSTVEKKAFCEKRYGTKGRTES